MTKAVEAIIQEAMQRGEFDNLPGAGEPIDLNAYFDTPEDVRLAYLVLKNANVLPQEAELLKEIAVLKEKLGSLTDEAARREIGKAIEDRLLKFNIMMDRRKPRA